VIADTFVGTCDGRNVVVTTSSAHVLIGEERDRSWHAFNGKQAVELATALLEASETLNDPPA
jgi:hypothetical protein